jgi:hypothetical protein
MPHSRKLRVIFLQFLNDAALLDHRQRSCQQRVLRSIHGQPPTNVSPVPRWIDRLRGESRPTIDNRHDRRAINVPLTMVKSGAGRPRPGTQVGSSDTMTACFVQIPKLMVQLLIASGGASGSRMDRECKSSHCQCLAEVRASPSRHRPGQAQQTWREDEPPEGECASAPIPGDDQHQGDKHLENCLHPGECDHLNWPRFGRRDRPVPPPPPGPRPGRRIPGCAEPADRRGRPGR